MTNANFCHYIQIHSINTMIFRSKFFLLLSFSLVAPQTAQSALIQFGCCCKIKSLKSTRSLLLRSHSKKFFHILYTYIRTYRCNAIHNNTDVCGITIKIASLSKCLQFIVRAIHSNVFFSPIFRANFCIDTFALSTSLLFRRCCCFSFKQKQQNE